MTLYIGCMGIRVPKKKVEKAVIVCSKCGVRWGKKPEGQFKEDCPFCGCRWEKKVG